MTAETSHVEKTRKNEIAYLWHKRLGHVSYKRLKVMMMKWIVKGLPNHQVRDETIYAGS